MDRVRGEVQLNCLLLFLISTTPNFKVTKMKLGYNKTPVPIKAYNNKNEKPEII